jgi:hypothetical protein
MNDPTSKPQSGGFLGRWSRLKADARQGIEATDPSPTEHSPSAHPAVRPSAAATPVAKDASVKEAAAKAAASTSETAPPPTLDDVAKLTPQSDFTAYVGRSVSPDVKNAAMKKLFADPHFNVMDGLDVYIDDYSQPDPLAPALLRQMASAKFMKLVDDETVADPLKADPPVGDTAEATPSQTVAQSAPGPMASATADASDSETDVPPSNHDHPDLRLQPDAAAGRPSPGEPTA